VPRECSKLTDLEIQSPNRQHPAAHLQFGVVLRFLRFLWVHWPRGVSGGMLQLGSHRV
jgi:hypothetical protein